MRRYLASPLLASAHAGGTRAHGLDDVVVASAPAEVALEPVPDVVLARIGVVATQVGRTHDHARRAEPALQTVVLLKRRLHRVQRAAAGEALDRRDLRAV